MTKEELKEIEERCEKSRKALGNICDNRWTMHIPSEPDDADLVIANTLSDIPRLIEEARRLDEIGMNLRERIKELEADLIRF